MKQTEKIKQIYDVLYSLGDVGFGKSRQGSLDAAEIYRDLVETTAIQASFGSGDLVLDAGCGTGRISLRLAQMGVKVVGLDISFNGVSRARRCDSRRLVDFLVADINFLPFRDSVFDGIFFIGTFEYFKDISAPLHEAFRVTKTCGQIIFNVWHGMGHRLENILKLTDWRRHRDADFFPRRFHIIQDLYMCMIETGFRQVDFKGHFFILPEDLYILSKILRKLFSVSDIALALFAYSLNKIISKSSVGKYGSSNIIALGTKA